MKDKGWVAPRPSKQRAAFSPSDSPPCSSGALNPLLHLRSGLTDNCNQQAQNGHQSIADNTHANGSYRASVSASALSVCNAESTLDCTALSPTNLMTERSSIHHHQNECPLLCDGLQGRKRVPPCLQARRRDSRRCDQTWRSQSGCRRCCLPPRGS